MRLHSVSLYDEQANCLWLSEGALGPDEHNLVLDALEVLSNDKSLPCYENGVEDGRVAIFLPIRAPQGDLVGVAMILADLKSVGDGVLEKILSPQVRPIMQKIAVLMRAASRPNAEPSAPITVQVAPVLELTPDRAPAARAPTPAPSAPAPTPPKGAPAATKATPAAAKPGINSKTNGVQPAPTLAAANRPAAAPLAFVPPTVAAAAPAAHEQPLSPQAIDDILEFELFPEGPPSSFSSEEEVPMSPASSFQQSDSLAWDVTGSALQLTADFSAPPAPAAAPAKPAVTPAPVRAAAAAKQAAPQPAAAKTPVASIPTVSPQHAVPSLEPQPGPPLPSAVHAPGKPGVAGAQPNGLRPVAQPPVLQAPVLQAPVLQIPVLEAPSLAPVLAAAASAAVNPTPMAVALDLTPPAALMNGAAANPTAAAPKSTNATTTSKALPTEAARALNGAATGNVQALTSATQTSRTIALDPSNLILDIQPFSKLRAGGRMRRYEVLPRIPHRDANRAPAAMDGLALQRLLSWLGSNRSAWNLEPTSFSLNLSISTLEDERFLQQVASALKANGIAPDNLGFEIAEPLCTQRRAQVERFITLCDKLGCFVVIDDFSFDSSVLPLLRSKALRLVKIDPKLTSAALKDKLSQAMVVAIVQAVKVLGIHCAAKRVESQASLQWLTAIGCDLAQGPALSQVLPIESLNMPQPVAAEAGKTA
jgi:EAL domain-containing protein (putative c-di-GMP-specific phosphodiesterase class I)